MDINFPLQSGQSSDKAIINTFKFIIIFIAVIHYSLLKLGSTKNIILQKIPSHEETYSLLRDKSSQWNEIGRVLGVPFSKREEFRTDPTRNIDSRLEAVVNLWLQNGGDTSTWDQLIRKLQELGLNDIISKINSHISRNK